MLRRALRRRSVAPLLLLGLAYALVMQSLGWAQTSYLAAIKALVHERTAQIDPYHWETRDKSWFEGHFYSVKAPGLPFLTAPLYAGVDALGGDRLAGHVAGVAHRNGDSRWHYDSLPVHSYGYSEERRDRVQATLERETPIVWALGLLGTVLPAVLLLLAVRWCAERIEPGFGTIAAATLGAGTLILPFATQFFGHVLAAALVFGAFALLMREREGPSRQRTLALAGLLAGLAVTVEFQAVFAGAVVGAYAIARAGRVRRAAAYSAGAIAGAAPVALYNWWAFGSVTRMSYEDAVEISGRTGHSHVGLNEEGFFGITAPEPGTALELLLSARGLLTLAPVLAVAVFGLWLAARRDRRAEALTAGAVALVYLVWNSGYWTPFGGGSPGPRFLIPVLPFLALGVASAWRVRPAVTAALTVPSVVMMLAATLTRPLIGDPHSAGDWWALIERGLFSNTVLSAIGLGNGWPAALPVAVLVAIALMIARPRLRLGMAEDVRAAALAVAVWAMVASTAPAIWDAPAVVTGDDGAGALIGAGVLGAAVVLWWAWHEGRDIRRGRSRVADGSETDEFEAVVTV